MKNLSAFLLGIFFSISISSLALAADPTRPKFNHVKPQKSANKHPSKQALTGIIKKAKGYVAILDGEVYKQGDRFNGERITRISRTYVLLAGQQGTRRLTLISDLKSH